MANLITRTWNRIFGPAEVRASSGLENPSPWFKVLLGGGKTNSGVDVNVETALGISALWSAVDILASSIASLPFKVYRKNEEGNREELSGHPVSVLLNLFPNDHYLPFSFWYSMIANAILWGGSCAQIIRDQDGRPVRLKILLGSITPFEGSNGKLYYKISTVGNTLAAEDILFIPGLMSTDGICGRGIVQIFKETFGEGIAAQIFGQKFFANGAHLKGYISHPKSLSDIAFNHLKESWKERYEGMDNVGSTAILEEGAEFKPLTVSPKDSQYIDVKKNLVEEISRITRVPLHMLQSLDRATFNNIEVLGLDFVKYTLAPWLTKVTQECNRKLFYDGEMGSLYTEHNLKSLLRGDAQSRAVFYKELFYMSAITPNQIRALENMNGYEKGDQYYVQQNLVPVDKLDSIFEKENPISNE